MEKLLELRGIKKSFGGVRALKGIDLEIAKGETHCLAGENGCGKSTIIKIISGFYQPDEGQIIVDGQEQKKMTPAQSINAGIQVIYQDFSLFPNLTVRENLAYNKILAEKKKIISKKELDIIAKKAVEKINFKVDLNDLVENLPVADKQLVAISRALLENARLIIMDEPTTALTRKEIERLFSIVESLKEQGVTILFVSHKLEEVYEICDNITILRSGENVITCPVNEIDEEKFAYYMTGRKFEKHNKSVREQNPEVVLEADNITSEGFEDVSFKLHRGEILGITGQLGSGRSELSLALFGLNRISKGDILVNGKKVSINSVDDAKKLGIALVPEDRLTEGLFLSQPIKRNITVSRLDELASPIGIVSPKRIDEESSQWVTSIGVATADHNLPVATLSGGNQQKVVLARWLSTKPKILILNAPTVGVDIGAKYDIHALLRKYASEDMSIIVVSDDASEIISTCDRALVMKQGKITKEISTDKLDSSTLAAEIVSSGKE